MTKKFLSVGLLVCLIIIGIIPIAASDGINQRIVGIGFGYPYLALKYRPIPNLSVEARGSFGSGIYLFGGRAYLNFNPRSRLLIYAGGEADYTTFDTDEISGNGFAGLAFLGVEISATDHISFVADIGPMYSKITDSEDSSLSAEGTDWVLNLGINFYPPIRGSRELVSEFSPTLDVSKDTQVASPSQPRAAKNFIYGKVTDTNTISLTGVTIKVSQDGKEILRTYTDKDGNYTTPFDHPLLSGIYSVKAWFPGYASQNKDIGLTQSLEVNFTLQVERATLQTQEAIIHEE